MDTFVARLDLNMQEVAMEGVKAKADAISIDAESLQRYMLTLGDMPVYDTGIEAALKRAEVALLATTLVVRIAQENIKKHRG